MFVQTNGSNAVHRLRDEFDRMFGELFGEFAAASPLGLLSGRAFPALNLWEDAQNVYAEAEIPGLTMDDIEVIVVNNELTLKGERKENEPENFSFHRRERGVGAFSRVVHLPVEIDADKVQATLADGVLTITLPKAEVARPRKIEVRTPGR